LYSPQLLSSGHRGKAGGRGSADGMIEWGGRGTVKESGSGVSNLELPWGGGQGENNCCKVINKLLGVKKRSRHRGVLSQHNLERGQHRKKVDDLKGDGES